MKPARAIDQKTLDLISKGVGKKVTMHPTMSAEPTNENPEPFNWLKWGLVGLAIILIAVLLAR